MKKTFSVKGMHCNSCAQRIEDKLQGKVNKVSVYLAKEKAEIDFDENKISEKEIKKLIAQEGYTLEEIPKTESDESKRESNSFGWVVFAGSLILLFVVLYNLFGGINIQIPEVGDNSNLVLLFAIGLLTGFHCVSMCGGFVFSYTAKNALNGHKSFSQHLVYGGSKVVSYTIIGGIFGLVGGLFAFSIGLRGMVSIIAGLFMIFYALSMMGFGFFRKFQFNPKFLTRTAAKAGRSTDGPYLTPMVTGLLNGLFIACGPLQAMYLYAAGTGSVFTGATSLAVFGLGTLPIMLGFGGLATSMSHGTTKKILKISAIIVLVLGLIMINRGLTLTGSEYSFSAIQSKLAGTAVIGGAGAVLTDGVQTVNMDVSGSGYSPNSFVIKKGVPVKWNVNVKELTSCNQELVMRQYGINTNLKKGLNVIEFIPKASGTIQFSCGMGMLRGSFIVTETGTASQQQVASATPKSSGSCSMGSGGGGCGCGM